MKAKTFLAPCFGLLLGASAAFATDDDLPKISVHKTNPETEAFSPTAGGTGSLSPITNHGGPVIGSTVNVYVIWYGNWNQTNGSDNTAGQQLVRTFLSNVGNSPYFNINTTYAA